MRVVSNFSNCSRKKNHLKTQALCNHTHFTRWLLMLRAKATGYVYQNIQREYIIILKKKIFKSYSITFMDGGVDFVMQGKVN